MSRFSDLFHEEVAERELRGTDGNEMGEAGGERDEWVVKYATST